MGVLDNWMTNPGKIGVGENTDSVLEVKSLLVPEEGLKGKQVCFVASLPNPLTPSMSNQVYQARSYNHTITRGSRATYSWQRTGTNHW